MTRQSAAMAIRRKVMMLAVALLPVAAHAERAVPYWASIGPSSANMRSGPGREFPATWTYHRAGLPVKVIQTYPNWRKVADPDGTTGWIQANMIGERRTGLVKGGVQDLHASADLASQVVWRAEAGVVGTISQCRNGWCLLDVQGKAGYVETAHLWGLDANERLP